jgi:hypothetical protein
LNSVILTIKLINNLLLTTRPLKNFHPAPSVNTNVSDQSQSDF